MEATFLSPAAAPTRGGEIFHFFAASEHVSRGKCGQTVCLFQLLAAVAESGTLAGISKGGVSRARRDARFGNKDERVCCKVSQQRRYVLHMPLQLHTRSVSLASCKSRSEDSSHPHPRFLHIVTRLKHAYVSMCIYVYICVRSVFVVDKSHLTLSCISGCIGQHGSCTSSFTMQLPDDALSMFDSAPHCAGTNKKCLS